MGRELVSLATNSGLNTVCINRGKKYWGSNSAGESVRADRRDQKKYCQTIIEVLRTRTDWIGIVDFCAYDLDDIAAIPDKIFHSVPVYVFVSTDSVYEVCLSGDEKFVTEQMAASSEQSIRDPSRDDYGYKKLLCEFALTSRSKNTKCKIFSLRLPDVLGEHDDTHRFWGLKLWIESGTPIRIDEALSSSSGIVSFCYSKDVVRVILNLLNHPNNVSGGPINVCCDEQISMNQFIGIVRNACGVEVADLKNGLTPGMTYLPSVEVRRGALDNSRMKQVIQFKPTPIVDVVELTVKWLNEIGQKKFRREYYETISDLPRIVRMRYCDMIGMNDPGSSSSSDSSSSSNS